MKSNYSYPIEYSLYSTEEIILLVQFFEQIEKYYQKQTTEAQIKASYDKFKKLVPGKADRNVMYKIFYQDSGYDAYLVTSKIDKLTKNSKQ